MPGAKTYNLKQRVRCFKLEVFSYSGSVSAIARNARKNTDIILHKRCWQVLVQAYKGDAIYPLYYRSTVLVYLLKHRKWKFSTHAR